MGQGHGWEGAVLKLLRAKDFVFTVTGAEDVTPQYRRVHLKDGGMLAVTGVHPTMWVRLWFDNAGKPHQRAYTLVDADPEAGTFSLEFALHEGCASDWARAAQPGDTIEATVHGTDFAHPDPAPSHVFAIADTASLPALNSLLGPGLRAGDGVVRGRAGRPALPDGRGPARRTDPAQARRRAHLVTQVKEALPDLLKGTDEPYVWIACDTATTRALTSYVRKELGLPKQRVNALGYWRP
ncbi:siderophore-interacting protein [Streptomyces sp. MS1.AVA.1]|uniref:Siderophore-interacting protein n=1 Tax=Streptomyces machairae TaxID=3134109 RepID=A0ABU8UNA5_9ACTN